MAAGAQHVSTPAAVCLMRKLCAIKVCAIKVGAMSKRLIALLICVVLPFAGALAAQEANTSKPAPTAKAGQKNADAYSPSSAAKTQFMRESGYRNGRPGYVVAYRKSLGCGGTESIENMEWLTIAEAKAKDKAARKGCK
jgi:hypothetical protein